MNNVAALHKNYAAVIEEDRISLVSEVCFYCRNFDGGNPAARQCAAFPDGIPEEIWRGANAHRNPYPGDNGIRFEPLRQKRAA